MFFIYILLAFFAAIFVVPIKFEAVCDGRRFNLAIVLFSLRFGLKSKDNNKIKKKDFKSGAQKFKFGKKKVKLFLKLFKCLFEFLLDVIKKIKIKKLLLKVNVGNADALGCVSLYSKIIFVLNSFSCFLPRSSEVKVLPNFLCEKTEYRFEIVIRIFFYQVLTSILKLAFRCTKLVMPTRK